MSDFRDPAQKATENKRMMIAMGVSMGVLMLWNSLFPAPMPSQSEAAEPQTEQVAQPTPDEAPVAVAEEQPADPAPNEAQGEVPAEAVAPKAALPEQTHQLQDEKRQVTLSNLGARPSAIFLVDEAHGKIYKEPGNEEERPRVDLAGNRADFGALKLPGLKPKTWSVIKADDKSVVYGTQAGALELRRTWTLGEYGLSHSLTMTAKQAVKGQAHLSLSMQDPLSGGSMFSGPPDLPRSLCHSGEELTASFASDLNDKDEPNPKVQKPHFFGVDRNFFAVLFTGEEIEECALDLRQIPGVEEDKPTDIVVVNASRAVELAAGETQTWNNTLYLLPKSDELLASVDPKLRDTIDFGIFKFIAQPMLWLLTFYFSLLGNYGLAIILLTFTVKLLLWPITDMSFRSMARMKEVQPELSKLREKYKADKQMLAQKQMELFKERGVNPAGGCFPMLLQIPVWFALYSTLRVAVELYGSPFIPGWLDDLTLADPYYILPVLLGIVFFMQQKLQPQMSDNPQQQMMMKVMPLMMTVFMVALPSGLVVYILVNTILGIGHQFYAIKRDAKPAA
jgi:YidC/Oxa1 family membrane protein insertase